MDLPTCKACGQSVLDDDAENCPWCGASMKTGKAAAASAKGPAAAVKSAPAAAAAGEQSAGTAARPTPPATAAPQRRAASGASAQADEDPFSVQSTADTDAVPAAPRPVKGCTHKVVCPMCETVGYVPRKAAGQPVRCANPKCLVPIFTAPEIKAAPVEPAPPPKSRPSAVVLGVSAAALVGAVGTGVWYFVFRDSKPAAPPPVVDVPQPSREDIRKAIIQQMTSGANSGAGVKNGQKTTPATPQEMQAAALGAMVDAAQKSDRNRSKPYCRRLTAEACALTGNSEAARNELEQLRRVGSKVPFYQVTPLVGIAWNELSAGRREAALQAVDEAWRASQQLPQIGRDPLDIATGLAAVLVAVGRDSDADALLDRFAGEPAVRAFSAAYCMASVRPEDRLDELADLPIVPWAAPQRVAACVELISRGKIAEAIRWGQAAADLESETECLAACAGILTGDALRRNQPVPQQSIDEILKSTGSAGQARVHAAIARAQLAAGQEAADALAAAAQALQSVSVPGVVSLPEMQVLLQFELADARPLRVAALASAELARVQMQRNDPDAAWKNVARALAYARGMAPSPAAIGQKLDEIQTLGMNAVGERLRQLLQLESADAGRIAARNYRANCQKIQEAASARFELQVALLRLAAEWGLREQVFQEAQSRQAQPDIHQREAYLTTPLPRHLAELFRAAGARDRADAVLAALGPIEAPEDPWPGVRRGLRVLVESGDDRAAANVLKSSPLDRWLLHFEAVRLATRLAAQEDPGRTLAFIAALDDQLWREDAYQLAAAQLGVRGKHEALWQHVQSAELPPTELISVYRGLIAGMTAAGR